MSLGGSDCRLFGVTVSRFGRLQCAQARAKAGGGSSSRMVRRTASRPRLINPLASKGVLAGQQLVEQHPQAVDVAARIDVQTAHLRLLRTHVGGRADELLEGGIDASSRSAAGRWSLWQCRNQSPSAPARRRATATRMLEGLMSRWMIPFWCACWMAWQTWMNSSSRSVRGRSGSRRNSR